MKTHNLFFKDFFLKFLNLNKHEKRKEKKNWYPRNQKENPGEEWANCDYTGGKRAKALENWGWEQGYFRKWAKYRRIGNEKSGWGLKFWNEKQRIMALMKWGIRTLRRTKGELQNQNEEKERDNRLNEQNSHIIASKVTRTPQPSPLSLQLFIFFSHFFLSFFYLLNIFKPLMRCNKYLNKLEIVLIFWYHLQQWKKELEEGNDQINSIPMHLYKINSILIKLR